MNIRPARPSVIILLVLAVLLLVDGLLIHGKAMVAQYLLKRAWQQSITSGTPVKPWPWADTRPVARLQVDRLQVDCIILEGESGEVLAFAPGHLSQSAAPAAQGNCALVGHRDTSFRFLQDLEKGDVLVLHNVRDEARRYQVVSTAVEDRHELFVEQTVTPWLTLITCYPFHGLRSGGDLRFVVFARELLDGVAELAVQHRRAD